MKMTRNFEYEHVLALSENRLEDAKNSLVAAILAAKNDNAPSVLAGLTQRFGSLLLKQGEKAGAIVLYELAEVLDTGSLLVKLEYAKFLLRELGERAAAIAKSEEIIAVALSNPFPESAEDFSSEEYIDAAKRILLEATKNREPPTL